MKTSSTRIKAAPTEAQKKTGNTLLLTGITCIVIAVILFIMWIIVPGFFAVFVVPMVVIFIPLVFYATVALTVYNTKYK